jgi:Domain of unknown function (DUF4326)
MTKLVNLRQPPAHIDNGVYIGRGTKWGNPFVIGKDGDRKTVVEKYRQRLWNDKTLLQQVPELEGKTLMCFCAPNLCHGHVLLSALAWWQKQRDELEIAVLAQEPVPDHATQCALALHDGC